MGRVDSTVNDEGAGKRLDRYLAEQHPEVSRSVVQQEIREGRVLVNGEVIQKVSQSLRIGQEISWIPPEPAALSPREIPLSILHEDDALIVIDKPIGLVVHPGAGTTATTLVEGLLASRALPASDDPSRPGIVHRLDKDTSGVIVVAKSDNALEHLQKQFADRSVSKTYVAVVEGVLDEEEGLIDAPVGRDPNRPSRMSVQPPGRSAQTEFDVLERYDDRTLLSAHPQTGRTHQIRVHFSYIKHPVIGDSIYPGKLKADRLMLHAWRLAFQHPVDGSQMRFEASIPEAFPPFNYDALPWRQIPEANQHSV